MKKQLKESLFYLTVGTVFFYGSINVQYREGIIRWNSLFDSYPLLFISIIFLVLAFMKYIDYKAVKELERKS